MVFLDKRASLEDFAFHVDFANVFADLLMINLRDWYFYDEYHELTEFELATRLFVGVIEFQDIYWVDEGVNQVFFVLLDTVFVKLKTRKIR